MNKSHREIKGETFTERVKPPKPTSVDVDVPKIPKRSMFKSILQTITKPFRKLPKYKRKVFTYGDSVFLILTVTWYVLSLELTFSVDTKTKHAKIQLTTHDKWIFGEDFDL